MDLKFDEKSNEVFILAQVEADIDKQWKRYLYYRITFNEQIYI